METSRRFVHEPTAQRVVFGQGRAGSDLPAEVDRLGGRRVLVLSTPRGAAEAETLTAAFADRVVARTTGVREHVPVDVAQAATDLAAAHDADLLLPIGGGSTIGTAKAVALETGLPILAVPTTYAGSEVTDVWGRTDAGRKTTGRDPRVRPRTVLYDPRLTVGLPVEVTVASAGNALAHAVEAFWTGRSTPAATALAEAAVRDLAAALPAVVDAPDDLEARTALLRGAWLAGEALFAAGTGLHHKLCHVLGGSFALPHAATHTILLPHVLAFLAPVVPDAAARLAAALGAPGDDPAAALADLLRRVGAPSALRDVGLAEHALVDAVDLALEAVPPDTPRPVDRDDLEALLQAAWRGDRAGAAPGRDRDAREQAVTDEVVARFAATPDPRLRELTQALVRHVHAFAREVRLREQEWAAAIEFLTRAGHLTDDRRQEFILLSDVLGLSMLTIGINHPADGPVTESTVVGPFFVEGSPRIDLGGDVAQGAPGAPAWVEGRVLDPDGRPVPGARLEVWEADDDGFYDVQYDDAGAGQRTQGRAHLFADADGGYRFWCVKPAPYPIPDDGPVGDLLAATARSPMRPAHLHFRVSADGYRTLTTHIFVAGSDHLDDDAVFGVKPSLIVPFAPQPPGVGPGDRRLDGPWFRAAFDLVLAPDTTVDGTHEAR